MARAARAAAVRATFQLFTAPRTTDAAEQLLKNARKPVHLKEIGCRPIAGEEKFRAKKSLFVSQIGVGL